MYLLGCRPPGSPPVPEGDWYADPQNKVIFTEYLHYDNHPRNVIARHKASAETLQTLFESVCARFSQFNADLDGIIAEAVRNRQEELQNRARILFALR